MPCQCIYLHSLFVYARNVPETCGAGWDTRIRAPRRRQCSRAVRCKRLPVSPPCGRQHSETRRAEGNVSKLLSAGDRPHLHTTHQAAFCDMLLIHHKSFAPDKQCIACGGYLYTPPRSGACHQTAFRDLPCGGLSAATRRTKGKDGNRRRFPLSYSPLFSV